MKISHNVILGITLSLGLSITSLNAFAQRKIIENIAVVVNNDVVLETDIAEMMNAIKQNIPNNSEQPSVEELRQQVIDRLILESLILQEAAKFNIRISDEQLYNTIAGIAQEHNMDVDELRANLAAVGIDYSTYRNNIRKDMLLEAVRNQIVSSRIHIIPQEVEALSKQLLSKPSDDYEISLSQILIPLPEEPSTADLKKAQNTLRTILVQLSKKVSFSSLAKTYSADPTTSNRGGEMGWTRVNELPSLFVEELKSPKKGQVVGPIRSGVGFHLLRVNGVRGAEKFVPKKVAATEYHARHILLQPSVVKNTQIIQLELNKIREQIINGELTFEEAAKKYSDDLQSGLQGGDLGWNIPERYDAGFAQALTKLKIGDISQPIQSAFGWHLIQLIETREVDRTELALQEQAYRMIFNRKFSEEVQNWMQELRADAYIRFPDGENINVKQRD